MADLSREQFIDLQNIWNQITSQRNDFGGLYLGQQIPDEKLRNARQSYGNQKARGSPIMLHDKSMIGSAKLGFVLTTYELFYKNTYNTPAGFISIEDILDMTITENACSVLTTYGTEQILGLPGNFYMLKAFIDYLKSIGKTTQTNTGKQGQPGVCKSCGAHNSASTGTCDFCGALL